jgi:sugar lactone lactonase YvrE
VPIQGDTTVEPDELVNLTLASPTGGAVIGSPSTATLTIVNNDGAGAAGTLQFSSATYFQLEGDSGTSLAAITVTRIGGTFGAVGVSYATSNGTATAGSDYTATSGTLSWANGETGTKTFTVTVQGDTTAEPDETVNLTLSSATGGATLGSPANATLTIVLDEAAPANGTLQFSAASYSAAEGNSGSSTATITVTRTGGSAGAVGVSFATGNGTATAGSDYTATNGTLSWADGDTAAKTFAVTVLGDTTVEGDETVNLTLSSPTGGAGLGSPATSVLTITNDDTTPANGTLQFSASFYTKAEGNSGNSTATITVTRTGGSSGAVGVSFATSNGTATAGSDYTATSGTLSWADGDTAAKTFAVTVLGDTTVEGDETVNLTLSSPTGGATLGTPTSATLTITNDDVASETFVNFEAQHTRPVCLSPDGTRLFVVNTPDARLSVFDVSNPANPLPVLIREIRTGIDPVAVNAVSNDEAWVVNELSDSVSIVSVSSGITVATLPCKDEPGDVVFAGGKAFVSCARNNGIRIFSISTLQELAFVTLTSQYPKALAVNAAGDRVYAVSKLSGNRTTLLPANLAPAQPAPTNTALPAAPDAGLIVTADDSRLSPKPNMPDNDVAEINVSTHAVARYFKGVGTINFAAAVRPGASGELWIANTEARNAIRFEPVLKGHSVDNRITMITTGTTPVVTPFDLNPGINYALFPNPGALATAVAQPAALEFEPDGTHLWVASFGTDRLARVNAASGAVVSRVDTGPPATSPNPTREKRGPRGLAWQAATGRLYVVNRLSNTIMVVNGTNGTLLGEMPCGTYDPTPAVIREGRGFLYDAKLSGNGTQSCASCHIDGDRDDIAWDLGDPGGNMDTATSTVPQTGATQTIQLHPMKGPMTTQTLRGIKGTDPLHWRGDRATFNQSCLHPDSRHCRLDDAGRASRRRSGQ